MRLGAPQKLIEGHDLSSFDCENEDLNSWLRERAHANEGKVSRTFVVCAGAHEVVAYYCLAAGAVTRAELQRRLRHNTPETIPVVVLGRLAVDKRYRGRGMGAALLRDAILRMLSVSEAAGVRAMIVHAIDDKVGAFYQRHGFVASPINPRTFVLPIETARSALKGEP